MGNPSLLPLRIRPSQDLDWSLYRRSRLMENLPDMILGIPYPKLSLNHINYPRTGPNHRISIQDFTQVLQWFLFQSLRSTRVFLLLETINPKILIPIYPIKNTPSPHNDSFTYLPWGKPSLMQQNHL